MLRLYVVLKILLGGMRILTISPATIARQYVVTIFLDIIVITTTRSLFFSGFLINDSNVSSRLPISSAAIIYLKIFEINSRVKMDFSLVEKFSTNDPSICRLRNRIFRARSNFINVKSILQRMKRNNGEHKWVRGSCETVVTSVYNNISIKAFQE